MEEFEISEAERALLAVYEDLRAILAEHGEELPPFAQRNGAEGAGGAVAGGQRPRRAAGPALRPGRVNAAEAVGRTLAALGVGDAFGVMGSGNFVTTQALHAAGAHFHHARHEGGAICMADGYARVSGRVGVCTVHQGPGFTNALTGLTEAAKARTPLLLVCGEAPAAALRSNFRVDQAGVAAALGAIPERIHSGASAAADTARAFRRAVVERRPVVLNMPLDVQLQEAPAGEPPGAPAVIHAPAPSPDAVAEVVALIAASRRPLILAGRGAVLAGAREPLEALGDAIGALLATSAMGHGLFAGSPWELGISGGFASPTAARLIRSADLVLAFGASLTRWTTRDGALIAPEAKVVQVDVDEDSLGAHRPVDAAVVGDAAQTARALVDAGAAGRGSAARRWRARSTRARGATSPTRTSPPTAAWIRARWRRRSTRCCPPTARSPWTRVTSWASRRCTCGCRIRRASCSRRRSSRSASAWRAGWAPRSRAPTG